MNEKSKTELYVEKINADILPYIDYAKLQKSYDTDMVYAKEILSSLHNTMVTAYGDEHLNAHDGDDGIVVIPGIVQGNETGKVAIALLSLDLYSSGEHCGTSFLCEHGVIEQGSERDNPNIKAMFKEMIPYEYCYTAVIPNDFHVDIKPLPEKLRAILADFQKHESALSEDRPLQSDNLDNIGVDDIEFHISEQEFTEKIKELMPDASDKAIECFITYANELDLDEVHSKGSLFSKIYVAYNLAAHKHGLDVATQTFNINENCALNPWEIIDAVRLVKEGASPDEIICKAIDGKLDLMPGEYGEMDSGLESFKNGTLTIPAATEKSSPAEKTHNVTEEPKKAKPRQKKINPEL